jgi:methylenetetrahydrofolate reductase (NADPH)
MSVATNTVRNVTETRSRARRLSEFVAAGSTEVTTHDEKLLEEYASLLPPEYTVYVAHTPKAEIEDVVRVALRLKALGLRPSPHIVARRVTAISRLRAALAALGEAGIDQVLLIAGDRAVPDGAFASTLELLESRATLDAGIMKIGVAGHPEGHPSVSEAVLFDALVRKQSFAERNGIRMHIATQFGFDTGTLGRWERELKAAGVRLPIHAGVAGPTPLTKLLKYALHCGVGASLKAVAGNSLSASRLPQLVTKADEMLIGVYAAKHLNPDSRIFAPHFFAFGGILETARWLRAVIEGSFELDAAGRGFSITN